MAISQLIKEAVSNSLSALYQQTFSEKDFQINPTKPEFEGDYTVVLFSLVKKLKRSPDILGDELGTYLITAHNNLFSTFNIIKGFLNLSISDEQWLTVLNAQFANSAFGRKEKKMKRL